MKQCVGKIIGGLLASVLCTAVVLFLIAYQETLSDSVLYTVLIAAFILTLAAVILIGCIRPLNSKKQNILYWLLCGGAALLTVGFWSVICQVWTKLFGL